MSEINSSQSNKKICGQNTNRMTICQRPARIGYDSCIYHKVIDEETSDFGEVHNNKNEIITTKENKFPQRGTLSYLIGVAILNNDGLYHDKPVSRVVIRNYCLVYWFKEINKENNKLHNRIIQRKIRLMVKQGLIIRTKLSYLVSPELKDYMVVNITGVK